MIDPDCFTIEWIKKKMKENRQTDPILIEKTIRALNLLLELKNTGLDFIFKGGTALMLLLSRETRLSIDIDIVVPLNTPDVDERLNAILAAGQFLRYELQNRQSGKAISKAHYKFFYQPVYSTHSTEEFILLDILYEDNPYAEVRATRVNSPFIKLKEQVEVQTPSKANLLGDKLTAFAPNTTGIPYQKGKAGMGMQIINQLYDISKLFDETDDIATIRTTFHTIVRQELSYRELHHLQPGDVHDDTFQIAFCLSTRGKAGNCPFQELQSGIRRIKSYVFSGKYVLEDVIISAAKAAYLTALIQNGKNTVERFSLKAIPAKTIEGTPYNKLNKLKKSLPEAFYYWFKALEIMHSQFNQKFQNNR